MTRHSGPCSPPMQRSCWRDSSPVRRAATAVTGAEARACRRSGRPSDRITAHADIPHDRRSQPNSFVNQLLSEVARTSMAELPVPLPLVQLVRRLYLRNTYSWWTST